MGRNSAITLGVVSGLENIKRIEFMYLEDLLTWRRVDACRTCLLFRYSTSKIDGGVVYRLTEFD
jgi:hypothetical protein